MNSGTRESGQAVPTAEEEFLKRNTDCVYFLASPLTCKKGNECEYRHSEAARINPRDCWYWMNGNCLNPKCAFRHPPLDGLIGTPGAPSVGLLSMPPSQNVALQLPPGHTPAYSLTKQPVPCYYFQKGLCLKGDRCSFMHGPQPTSDSSAQQQTPKASTTVSEPQDRKNTFGALQRCTQQQIALENIANTVRVPPPPKQVMTNETSLPKNGVVKRNILPLNALDDERLKYVTKNGPPIASGNSVPRSQHSRQAQAFDDRFPQNGKEADEFLREFSPGFDVLVDNGLRDSDYYQTEDDYRRTASHEGRHMNSGNDFEYDHSVDYAPVAKYDQKPYDDPYGKMQDHYALEQRRASSEKKSERPYLPEKRGYPRDGILDQIGESDLRHRLSKQRRVNGSRSVVSPDRRGDIHWRDDHDRHIQDQRYRNHSSRDSRHMPRENSRSNRLHSRLTLPGKSSPESNHNDPYPEREMDRGRNRARLSPGRPSISPHEGRHQDRIKWRGQDDFREARNTRGGPNGRDGVDNITLGFTGPKSLAVLKSANVLESSESRHAKVRQVSPLNEQKNPKIGKPLGHQESEGSLSFEGPKSLSEILKRKREVETASSGNSTVSRNREVDSPRESGEIITGSPGTSAVAETETVQTSVPEKEANHQTQVGSKEESRSSNADLVKAAEDNEGQIYAEGADMVHKGDSLDAQKGTEFETEDGMMVDDAMEDQEDQDLENFDNRDGEYDYEQADGGDDENVDPEEYFDDEDGDDFAKRIGVMFS
ncbi:zinc finger CCCH domain-containing protein 32-like [Macadamia integrifolia]|uniref:zinc finger CCCH domain-containing protein 32-like n=1 Tax=Macadamia integrifolia TaxID=60698 RepID=UPI001C4E7DE6|nr:zinc finger CCCH domain-containing protein 32-like [Macadamia integrifolia]